MAHSHSGVCEDQGMTIDEYIKEMEDQETEAELILGGDDGEHCTYSQGYLPRQAVFSCLTCTPAGNAGVCTACAMACHEDHEVVEIWTRRLFRCDCGNGKYNGSSCKLEPAKDSVNNKNVYNQNFRGVYCTCSRPYPDPDEGDDDVGDEMVQCCACEDWFHKKHLGLTSWQEVPLDEDGDAAYSDLVCPTCSTSCCRFLSLYPHLHVTLASKGVSVDNPGDPVVSSIHAGMHSESSRLAAADEPEISSNCSAEVKKGDKNVKDPLMCSTSKALETAHPPCLPWAAPVHCRQPPNQNCSPDRGFQESAPRVEETERAQCGQVKLLGSAASNCLGTTFAQNISSQSPSAPLDTAGCAAASLSDPVNRNLSADGSAGACQISKLVKGEDLLKLGQGSTATFLIGGWREQLCTCQACVRMYEKENVSFFLDPKDSLEYYEAEAQRRRQQSGQTSLMERSKAAEQKFLNGLSQMQQREILHGFNELKSALSTFLSPYASAGKTLKTEDIDNFFRVLKEKKQRLR